jgi:phytoene dehydrogenase-like protein
MRGFITKAYDVNHTFEVELFSYISSSTSMTENIIIGGGIAGLSVANYLHRAGREVLILEATDRVGGRVRTDKIDGFILDHGFQVLLTAYPEAKHLLDYEALKLNFLATFPLLLP